MWLSLALPGSVSLIILGWIISFIAIARFYRYFEGWFKKKTDLAPPKIESPYVRVPLRCLFFVIGLFVIFLGIQSFFPDAEPTAKLAPAPTPVLVPAPAPSPAPAPLPAPPPEPEPPPNRPPEIYDLDFVDRKFIGVGDTARVRVIAADPDKDDDIGYIWDAIRGYIPEEGLMIPDYEVNYTAPNTHGADNISVNVTDEHDNTNTEVMGFLVYDQKTAEKAQSYLEQVIFLAQTGDYQSSAEQLTKLTSIVPEFHEVYLLRGQAYTELEGYPQAIDDYRKYIELEPTDMDAYLLRARANLLWGDSEAALLDVKHFYSFAELLKPWRIGSLEPYESLRTDRERLMWMDDAISVDVLLPYYLQ